MNLDNPIKFFVIAIFGVMTLSTVIAIFGMSKANLAGQASEQVKIKYFSDGTIQVSDSIYLMQEGKATPAPESIAGCWYAGCADGTRGKMCGSCYTPTQISKQEFEKRFT